MRYKLREQQQLRPLGGHHFIENKIKMDGDTLKEVVRKVTDYRVNNNQPIGDPEQQILQYYARRWPFMVDPDDSIPEDHSNYLTDKWVSWIRSQWKAPQGKIVTTQEAQQRWEVCLKCPYNVPIRIVTAEHVDMKRKAFLLKRGQDTPVGLGFCSRHLQDLSVSVFLETPVESSAAPKDGANPTNCWVV